MIPALSIRQPWAWLIVNGHKDIENRTWATPFRGRFLVHASKTVDREAYNAALAIADEFLPHTRKSFPAIEAFHRGGFVGWSTVEDCVQEHASPWLMPEHWGFVLTNSEPMPFTPWKGRLGWFNVPEQAITHQPHPAGA